ncbi:MAG: hypothetical protein V7L04_10760 [Nostoc sp.]
MWEKLWHREKSQKPPISEEAEQKKQRLKEKRIVQRKKPFEEKESYRWVEAFEKVKTLFSSLKTPIGGQTSRVIHVFERVFAPPQNKKIWWSTFVVAGLNPPLIAF